jgi:DNA-directed RNA polymerase specialized sigma subunit
MDMLEDEFKAPYQAWKAGPTPATNSAMLTAMHPTIEGAIRTHVGNSNPMLMSRARMMALEGLTSYDPSKGKLQTHIYNHLQGLKRVNRQQTTILYVPERIAMDRYHLDAATKELTHTLGREPHDEEIANHTGFSPKRIAKVRSYNPAVSEGTIDTLTQGAGPYGEVHTPGKQRDLALDIIHDELDDYHKLVLEHTLGINGKRPLSNEGLAHRLRRSPGAISQAKLRIQQKLDNVRDLLPPQ